MKHKQIKQVTNKQKVNLRIFEGGEASTVLFQPRIYYWYNWNKTRGSLPEKYRKMSMIEVYDDLRISPRYFPEVLGLVDVKAEYSKKVKIKEEIRADTRITVIYTPKGEIIKEEKWSSTNYNWRISRYPIKNPEDIEKLIWLFENTTWLFLKENFEDASRIFRNKGEPQFFLPRSGYQTLFIDWMGLENLIYGLADFSEKIEQLIKAINKSYDSLYENIISYGKVKIINFGENIDANVAPPQYFEKYCIPFYEERANQLKKAGIYTHIHIDGSFRPLLKYLKDLPFDGLEALTPLPQGDVTLEEIKEAIGEKILLDGIPAILFLSNNSLEKLQEFVERLVKIFYPKLILGVSDELPPPANIERVRFISQYCINLYKVGL